MEDQPSKLWNIALILSLLLLAGVCYVKIEPVRAFVDEKCPWVKEQLAKYNIPIPGSAPDAVPAGNAAPVALAAPSGPAPADSAPAAPTNAAVAKSTPPAAPKVQLPPLDMARLAADQSLWPKKVCLKKDTIFAAVLNKKKVGDLNVPAGTEVMLVQVRADKLGVAYTPNGSMDNAGGAMIPPEDTDVLARVNAARR
jgi:hypothetical protein